jgi:hypothetical protein
MGVVPKPDIINQLLPGHAGRGRNGRQPQIIVIHTQAGNGNPFGWFQSLGTSGPNAADCTIWNPASVDGKLVRYLYDGDTAWTNGSWTDPNLKNPVLSGLYKAGIYSGDVSLTVENEGFSTFTDAQYTRLAQIVAWWSDQYKIPIDRDHIVGHSEIGPHKYCPGANFDFNRLISTSNQLYKAAYGMPTQPLNPRFRRFVVNFAGIEETITVTDPFLSVWEKYGGTSVLGDPMTPERDAAKDYPNLGYKGTYQIFERCRLEFHDNDGRVYLGRVGAEWLNMVGRKG